MTDTTSVRSAEASRLFYLFEVDAINPLGPDTTAGHEYVCRCTTPPLTPPMTPPAGGNRTPRPEDYQPWARASAYGPSTDSVEQSPSGDATPKARGPSLTTMVSPESLRQALAPLAQECADLAPAPAMSPLAALRASPPVDAAGRPRPMPKGFKASLILTFNVERADAQKFASVARQLGPERTARGIRFDNYAVLRAAAASSAAFDCLKLALAALSDSELCTVMRQDSSMLIEAASRAGHIDYSNALIAAYGQNELQLISER